MAVVVNKNQVWVQQRSPRDVPQQPWNHGWLWRGLLRVPEAHVFSAEGDHRGEFRCLAGRSPALSCISPDG